MEGRRTLEVRSAVLLGILGEGLSASQRTAPDEVCSAQTGQSI